MATVPSGQKFHTVPSNVETNNLGSKLANDQREIFTMQDIADTVASSVSSNPQVIDLKVTDGTVVTGTTVGTISQSLLIPANTFTSSGGMLEFMARYQKTGTAGSQTTTVLLNTSVSFTGATSIAWFSATSPTFIQGIRTARISSNTLTLISALSTALTDYAQTSNAQTSVSFDPTVDNYLLFVIQLANAADSSVVEMARATKYE
jgi:hypothetical protein